MKKFIILLAGILFLLPVRGQMMFTAGKAKHTPKVYRGERRKINDLVHTDLKLKLHVKEHTAEGEVELTLKPHFYPTDSLTLDAKAMQIYAVKVNDREVKYTYNGKKLKIRLPKTYTRNESYKVYVRYLAQPDSVKAPKGSAITDNRGLYFINTDGQSGDYPAQVWTQGEPESNSAWVPTLDTPNQKTTFRLQLTYPGGWVSLSNGKKTASRENADGTRTDTWELMQKFPPYLMFFFTGPFEVVKDTYKGKPVDYYVEKKYKNVARKIFGKTPEMIRYFSRITGVEYPWNKYDQVVTRKFVSGAMENVTAVNHSEMAYQKESELVDGNHWEDVIAHELFHHWFGDLVTAESWAQIAMNESFATYGEALWEEHDEGKDKADYVLDKNRDMYLISPVFATKPLVRHYYSNPDEVFDMVSYQKGSLILHMLRKTVGDEAFFAGLNKYLTSLKYKTGEAEQLRLAMEEVSGMDLTPFFRQWFYRPGHPYLKVQYHFDDTKKEGTVEIIQQTDSLWNVPVKIDIYEGDQYSSHTLQVKDSVNTLHFSYTRKPDFINVNADHVLLAVIDDPRPEETYYFQFKHAKNYIDRKMGLNKAGANVHKREAFEVIVLALDDPFYVIREKAIELLDVKSPFFNNKIEKKLYRIAQKDPKTLVRAAAIKKLGETGKKKYVKMFEKALHSTSAAVKKAALIALLKSDREKAKKILSALNETEKKELGIQLLGFYTDVKMEKEMPFVARHLTDNLMEIFRGEGREIFEKAIHWISTSDNVEANKILADNLYALGKNYKQYGLQKMMIMMLSSLISNQQQNQGVHKNEIISYYKQTIEKLKKA